MPTLPPVLCSRPCDLPANITAALIPGTTHGACCRCGEVVLIAPSTARMIAAGDCEPWCPPCLILKANLDGYVVMMTAEQLADAVKMR